MTGDSDSVTGDSEHPLGIGHVKSEWPVTFRRNGRSRSIGMVGHLGSEYASAKPSYLTENYRSARNIVDAANQVIEIAANRMKADHPITVDRAREKAPAGGDWEALDPVSKGCVQILRSESSLISQAVVAMKELERKAALDADWDWSNVAVIAREWKFLEPVRSYCEREGIPVQMADEQPPPMWRLRETRQLMDWMESRGSHLTDISSVREWLHSQGPGPWWEQLEEVVEALSLEVGEAEIPVKHFIEWLVEWGREIRRRQTGLLLLTAHRAKGLEFDHVVVLDGGWEKIGKGEDRDASRRLYYVAMSRAKQTLSLLRSSRAHPFLDTLDGSTAPFIERAALEGVDHDLTGLDSRYLRLTLKDVDIGFAGRFFSSHAVHLAIASLKPGDSLRLQANGSRWDLLDGQGRLVGRLAKSFVPPRGMTLESAHITAIIQRYREDSSAEYQSLIKCDQWEVVVPELIFGC